MESNGQFKSLQNLEKSSALAAEYPSYLVKRCTELLSQPLNEYSIEDMRAMISQQIGLDYLISLALKQLNTSILPEGDYYPGDLLTAILKVDKVYWSKKNLFLTELRGLIKINRDLLLQSEIPSPLLGDIT